MVRIPKKIFSFIEHEQGHLVVEACAGSGKSTTLIKCLDFIPSNDKILLTAFNTDIVNELKKKTNGKDNIDIKTLHGLGLQFIKEICHKLVQFMNHLNMIHT